MKKTTIYFSCVCCILGLLAGCEHEITYLWDDVSPSDVNTRSVALWDECSTCILPSGETVILPWGNAAHTAIPEEIRKDIKSADGWTVLDSTVEFTNQSVEVTPADRYVNYLLLYNVNTGVLKGFYYAERMEGNNCGFWQLSTSSPTKLFNFASYFAEPLNG